MKPEQEGLGKICGRHSMWELGRVCLRPERNHGLIWQMRPVTLHLQLFKSYTTFFMSIGRADENIEVEEFRKKPKSICKINIKSYNIHIIILYII